MHGSLNKLRVDRDYIFLNLSMAGYFADVTGCNAEDSPIAGRYAEAAHTGGYRNEIFGVIL